MCGLETNLAVSHGLCDIPSAKRPAWPKAEGNCFPHFARGAVHVAPAQLDCYIRPWHKSRLNAQQSNIRILKRRGEVGIRNLSCVTKDPSFCAGGYTSSTERGAFGEVSLRSKDSLLATLDQLEVLLPFEISTHDQWSMDMRTCHCLWTVVGACKSGLIRAIPTRCPPPA